MLTISQIILVTTIQVAAMGHGISPKVALAVAQQESQLNPKAIGALGERGVFQLRPEFHKEYTIKQLEDPNINIQAGLDYMVQMQHQCVHKKDLDYLTCWNMGLTAAKSLKHPSLFPYVVAVKKKIKLIASL